MTVNTLLKEKVGLLEDVNVEEVHFEVDNNGSKEVRTYSLDDAVEADLGYGYFYAVKDSGFYWGNVAWGEYLEYDYTEYLDYLLCEYDHRDPDTFLVDNKENLGRMFTDDIINDKDAFESFFLLTSYNQIYEMRPLIKQLKEFLTEYYSNYVTYLLEDRG